MADSLRDLLPEVCRAWLPDFFDRPATPETRSTCLDCAMCGEKGAREVASRRTLDVFRPDVKCCTWHPDLPNYLVGAALRDTAPSMESGRTRLRAKIAARAGVSPLGISPPPRYTVLYNFLTQPDVDGSPSGFAASEELVCPYLERRDATCTLWPYRERVCATWFCKMDARAGGYAAWQALKDYLGHVEVEISRYAATTVVGAPVVITRPAPHAPLSRAALAGERSDVDYAAEWGPYVGREEEFYLACAGVVGDLTGDVAAGILGRGEGPELLRRAEQLHEAATRPRLAPRLVLRRDKPAVVVADGVRVLTYHRFDPVIISTELYALLELFSADESTASNVERIRRERGVDLPDSVVLQMQVYGVMIPPP
jgi:hypothetical protein